MVSPGRGTPGICLIGMCRPKRYGFCSVLVRFGSDYRIRECMNVFVVSIPNENERKSNKRIRNGL